MNLNSLRRTLTTLGLLLWALPNHSAEVPSLPPIAAEKPFTFVVLGDSRGGSDGQQTATFRQILHAVNEVAPSFVWHTGDMIYGKTPDASVARDQWRIYSETISNLHAPIFHAPGNHDIWDESSAKIYQEVLGPPYYSFDYGSSRFIALDTETDPSRLGVRQFEWLKQKLEQAGERPIFIFLHRPLYPVDGAIGSSFDKYPADRDQLHRLFVQHRRHLKAVFQGHEHLYNFQERDGVPYYITGGGGANLYVPPELGGFHHFLVVGVNGSDVEVTLKKVGAPATPLHVPASLAAGQLLESWEEGLFWNSWDYTVTTEITSELASDGKSALRLNFDLAQNPWPVLTLPLPSTWNLRALSAVSMDVYLPNSLDGNFSLTPGFEAKGKRETTPVKLNPGWNTVRMEFNDSWFREIKQTDVRAMHWSLNADSKDARGSITFDNLRAERSSQPGAPESESLDSWERPLLWRLVDETVTGETSPLFSTEGKHGIKVNLDFSKCDSPMLLAQLNPPWNLRQVKALVIDVYTPNDWTTGLSLALTLRSSETDHSAPPVPLRKGWNKIKVSMDGNWLPGKARSAAQQLRWVVSSTDLDRGWIVFDNLRVE